MRLKNACLCVPSKIQTGCGIGQSAREATSRGPGLWEGQPGAQASTMFPSLDKGPQRSYSPEPFACEGALAFLD